jgi:hypothetical protein
MTLTPIWRSHDGGVIDGPSGGSGNAEVSKFHPSILVGKDVGTLYVSMNDALIM